MDNFILFEYNKNTEIVHSTLIAVSLLEVQINKKKVIKP